MSGSAEITIPPHGIPEDMVRIIVASSKQPQSRHITVEKAARVRFLLQYEGPADFLLHLNIRAGAYVDVFHYWPKPSTELLSSRSAYGLQEHSSLNVWTFIPGGRASFEHRVEFQASHAFASLNGLTILSGDAQTEHRVQAVHQADSCVSRQFYKSIVSGQARSAFESLVEVTRAGQKTDSRQLSKNLLLSRTARAFSRPQLKIDADDVSCAHGSATGQLNEEEVFYARTRGMGLRQARQMMIGAFAGEILETLPDISLRRELAREVSDRVTELAA